VRIGDEHDDGSITHIDPIHITELELRNRDA
jgi:hypothetical protein